MPDEATYRSLMEDIETLTGLGSVTLCLMDPGTRQAGSVLLDPTQCGSHAVFLSSSALRHLLG
jgi:hypothetical protein